MCISKFFVYFQYVFSSQPIPTDPNESFAWKDSTLDRKLKELEERAKKQGDVQLDVNGFDKNIDKSIGNWSSLPKAPNSDILLLQKARGKITTTKKNLKTFFCNFDFFFFQRRKKSRNSWKTTINIVKTLLVLYLNSKVNLKRNLENILVWDQKLEKVTF